MSTRSSTDYIDSRDLLNELRDLLGDPYYEECGNDPADAHREEGYEDLAEAWAALDDDDKARVQAIRTVLEELPETTVDLGNSWGCTMIPESEFTAYAEELAEDLGVMPDPDHWPTMYIDWEAAAEALKADYTSIEFDGITYLCR
jgi:antirestriction protein